MREIADGLRLWLEGSETFAIAVIARAWSSAPRSAGTMMAVSDGGEVLGSLSGGCVEGAVYELAQEVMSDRLSRAAHYGVSDGDAMTVGLTCGGQLDVVVHLVEPNSPAAEVLSQLLRLLAADSPVALAMRVVTGTQPVDPGGDLGKIMLVTDGEASGRLGSTRLTEAVAGDARGWLASGRTGILRMGADGQRLGDDCEVLVASLTPRPRLIVFGAIDYSRALSELGSFLGYHVTVSDARRVFTTPQRFPAADEVVVQWPHRYLKAEIAAGRVGPSTVLAMLTHDLKFDVPLLQVALYSSAGYIGAMGSRRTNAQREEELRLAGVDDVALARLHTPIGLDLDARTPEATAVSIMAEVLQNMSGGTGAQLRRTKGPIHQKI